ncbi:hypothetical protein TH53_08395 [Pedobacter lusitanus]|uniref:Uncharacterized protein n=2 Tax=Pedobacter lusitanus TaxID=1503925 RepID=A0A0D0GN86_9SPHI|nr:hypothetical protein TH53_08395 [Pedobacter lusitanus]
MTIPVFLATAESVRVKSGAKNEVLTVSARVSKTQIWRAVMTFKGHRIPVAGAIFKNETTGQTAVANAAGDAVLNVNVGDVVGSYDPKGINNNLNVVVTPEIYAQAQYQVIVRAQI